jgi:hypothetical protein
MRCVVAMVPMGGLPEAHWVCRVKVVLGPATFGYMDSSAEACDGNFAMALGAGHVVYGEGHSAVCIPPACSSWVGCGAMGEKRCAGV